MNAAYARLLRLVLDTPGAAAQLTEAYRAALIGEYATAQISIAIAARAIALAHPEDIDDVVVLERVLRPRFAPLPRHH